MNTGKEMTPADRIQRARDRLELAAVRAQTAISTLNMQGLRECENPITKAAINRHDAAHYARLAAEELEAVIIPSDDNYHCTACGKEVEGILSSDARSEAGECHDCHDKGGPGGSAGGE